MGKHKKANRRGSGGKLTEGDRLARDVHGRKGMDKERREKGAGVKPLAKTESAQDEELTIMEFSILKRLATMQKYGPPGESVESLKWILGDEGADLKLEADIVVLPIVESINRKKGVWVKHIYGEGVYLENVYRDRIIKFIREYQIKFG